MKLCIVQPNAETASETFLRAHATMLPAEVRVLYGTRPRVARQPVALASRLARLQIQATRVWSRKPEQWEITQRYLHEFQKWQPDVVLAEYGPTGVRVMEACRTMRIPLAVHFHGFDASAYETLEGHQDTYPRLFQEALAVVAVSRAMHKKLVSIGAPSYKVHYNPCGVSCNEFNDADPATAPPVFLFVGRLVDKKAPHRTIMAFAELHRRHNSARLKIIGSGPLMSFCRELVTKLTLSDAVSLLGSCSHERVRNEMSMARAYVQHSMVSASGDSEGTPVSVMEAGAAGLPVISTYHAGIPDVVLHEETGLLVEEGDTFGMAQEMLRLVEQPELAGQLGRAAQIRIRQHFSMEQSIGRLWSIIENCTMGASGDTNTYTDTKTVQENVNNSVGIRRTDRSKCA